MHLSTLLNTLQADFEIPDWHRRQDEHARFTSSQVAPSTSPPHLLILLETDHASQRTVNILTTSHILVSLEAVEMHYTQWKSRKDRSRRSGVGNSGKVGGMGSWGAGVGWWGLAVWEGL